MRNTHISIYIIKSNITRIYRQDNRKRFIAVNINHLNCVAIIYFKLLHLLLIHRNKCSFIISLYSKLHNSSLNPRKSSTSTEKISEGKSWTIDIDGKSVVAHVLRIRNICSHRVRNTSIDRPILLDLLRRTNVCFQIARCYANVVTYIKKTNKYAANGRKVLKSRRAKGRNRLSA